VALHRARERLREKLENSGSPELSRSDAVRGVSI
jgi:hypothetical protein